jgi:hypothetical protein
LGYAALYGTPDPLGEGIERIQRRDRDGPRWRRIGRTSQTREVRAIAYVSGSSGLVAALEAAKGLQGELVDLVDPHGLTWHDCRVIAVTVGAVAACIRNGAAQKRVEFVYALEMESQTETG